MTAKEGCPWSCGGVCVSTALRLGLVKIAKKGLSKMTLTSRNMEIAEI